MAHHLISPFSSLAQCQLRSSPSLYQQCSRPLFLPSKDFSIALFLLRKNLFLFILRNVLCHSDFSRLTSVTKIPLILTFQYGTIHSPTLYVTPKILSTTYCNCFLLWSDTDPEPRLVEKINSVHNHQH
jgi:hypothetical protein